MNARQRRQARARQTTQRCEPRNPEQTCLQRALQLGPTEEEIHRCVADPDQTYCCPPQYGTGRRVYQRRNIAVVLAEEPRTVVMSTAAEI